MCRASSETLSDSPSRPASWGVGRQPSETDCEQLSPRQLLEMLTRQQRWAYDSGSMGQIEFFDFPPSDGIAADPSPLERLVSITERFGTIVPQSLLHKELGLSQQRVHQLIAKNRFETFEIGGSKWVTVASVREFQRTEKALGGRPRKQAA